MARAAACGQCTASVFDPSGPWDGLPRPRSATASIGMLPLPAAAPSARETQERRAGDRIRGGRTHAELVLALGGQVEQLAALAGERYDKHAGLAAKQPVSNREFIFFFFSLQALNPGG